MKITAIETIQVEKYYNLIWTRIFTDEGIVGLGESFRNPEAIAAFIHETLAPFLVGRDPLRKPELWSMMRDKLDNKFTGFPTRSIEVRAMSAIDMALWDLAGKAANMPIHQLLGGLCRDKIAVYNTCVRPGRNNFSRSVFRYNPPSKPTCGSNDQGGSQGRVGDNLYAPAELAEELISEGYSAMKFSPFDNADKTNGLDISLADLKEGLKPVEAIRKAVGDEIDVYVDYHGRWRLPAARKIARALDDLGVTWHEDAVQMSNFEDIAALRREVKGLIVGSESFGSLEWFREALRRDCLDVMMFDIGWIGGVTEGRDIAALARSFDRPFCPHDATGPLILTSSVHLVMASPMALKQEIVRVFLEGYYRDLVTVLPRVENGFIYPMTAAGLGTELRPELLARDDVTVRRTEI